MYTNETTVRVRYAETDQMGYVYYGNYATYYEVARVEALRKLKLTYKKLEADGVLMPVAECWTKFVRPAVYDDLLKIKVIITDMPDKRITFDYEIYNRDEKLINLGKTTLAFVNAASGRPMKVPASIADLLKPFFDDE